MTNWQDIIVEPNFTIESAISILDKGGLRIVLVLDENNHLVGTVTDGDIRRALLNRLDLQLPVRCIMNKEPEFIMEPIDVKQAMNVMKKRRLLQLPVLNTDGILVDLIFHDDLNKSIRYDNPVFIMAGGFGKRLHPLTEKCPKPMIKVGNKPILEHIINSCANAGYVNFYISTHFMAEAIEDYFGDGSKWGVQITYVHESQPLGTAGALGLLSKRQISAPILMMNGDIISSVDLGKLRYAHCNNEAIATICVSEHRSQIPFGVVNHDGERVLSIEEKPEYQFFVNSGIYFLNPEIIAMIKNGEKIDMPDLLQRVIERGASVKMFAIQGTWIDVGRHNDLELARKLADDKKKL